MREDSPCILGIGNDIVEIERIRKSIDEFGKKFISKLFTAKEQEYCLTYKDPVPRFAGRFCAKEAIVKALGSGFGEHASWQDIEIENDHKGKPSVIFSKTVNDHFKNPRMLLSISHSELYAIAIAIWTK